MTATDIEVLCEHLATNIQPIIGHRATLLTRLIMRFLRSRLIGCTEEQLTLLFMEVSTVAEHVSNIESWVIPRDQLPDLQLVVERIRESVQ
jgi:hypothetical protein